MSENEKKWFDVEYGFQMSASTRCLRMKATSAEDALAKCSAAIREDGMLDSDKFAELGGDNSQEGWRPHAGTDYDYAIDVDGITETDDPVEEVE